MNTPKLPNNAKLISDIEGLEQYGRYCIDVDGNVYSCATNKRHIVSGHWTLAKPFLAHNGYLRIGLYGNSSTKPKKFPVHALVAKAFIPNPDNKPQVNHKNFDKRNNGIVNLEWVTGSENIQHALTVEGHQPNNKGELHGYSKLKDCDIPEIFKLKRSGVLQKDIAVMLNVSSSTISEVINRKKFKHVPIAQPLPNVGTQSRPS